MAFLRSSAVVCSALQVLIYLTILANMLQRCSCPFPHGQNPGLPDLTDLRDSITKTVAHLQKTDFILQPSMSASPFWWQGQVLATRFRHKTSHWTRSINTDSHPPVLQCALWPPSLHCWSPPRTSGLPAVATPPQQPPVTPPATAPALTSLDFSNHTPSFRGRDWGGQTGKLEPGDWVMFPSLEENR